MIFAKMRAEIKQLKKEHSDDQKAIVGLLSERERLRAQIHKMSDEIERMKAQVKEWEKTLKETSY